MNVPVPVGERCFYCEELIEADDQGMRQPYVSKDETKIINYHRECNFRQVAGPLAHMRKTCRCFGGTDHDTPGYTKREEAIAVWEAWLSGQYGP